VEAGPGARAALRRLAADPRMTAWVRRAVLAVTAGVALGIAAMWVLGSES